MRGFKKALSTTALLLAMFVANGVAAQETTVAGVSPETAAAVATGVEQPDNNGYGISEMAETMEEDEALSKSSKLSKEEKAEFAKQNDSWGGGITIISMCVVVGALVVLFLLFLCFGKISAAVMSHKKMKSTGVVRSKDEKHSRFDVDSGETIAAIALAVSEHFYKRRHDLEDTILTIKRMRRNYSPWNSKIYNLRQTPELKRNVRR